MGSPGSLVIRPSGGVGVLSSGAVAVRNSAGECPGCCGGPGGPCVCRIRPTAGLVCGATSPDAPIRVRVNANLVLEEVLSWRVAGVLGSWTARRVLVLAGEAATPTGPCTAAGDFAFSAWDNARGEGRARLTVALGTGGAFEQFPSVAPFWRLGPAQGFPPGPDGVVSLTLGVDAETSVTPWEYPHAVRGRQRIDSALWLLYDGDLGNGTFDRNAGEFAEAAVAGAGGQPELTAADNGSGVCTATGSRAVSGCAQLLASVTLTRLRHTVTDTYQGDTIAYRATLSGTFAAVLESVGCSGGTGGRVPGDPNAAAIEKLMAQASLCVGCGDR